MVFNDTFNNISVISWWLVLLVEETGENTRPVASHYYFALVHFSFSCKWTSLFDSCVLFTFTNLFCFNSFFREQDTWMKQGRNKEVPYMNKKNELKQNKLVNVNKTWMKQGSSLTIHVLLTFTNLFCFNSFFLFMQVNFLVSFISCSRSRNYFALVHFSFTRMKQGCSLTWTKKMI
jgi:hypothetical protein